MQCLRKGLLSKAKNRDRFVGYATAGSEPAGQLGPDMTVTPHQGFPASLVTADVPSLIRLLSSSNANIQGNLAQRQLQTVSP